MGKRLKPHFSRFMTAHIFAVIPLSLEKVITYSLSDTRYWAMSGRYATIV